jgi:hypothetical protein
MFGDSVNPAEISNFVTHTFESCDKGLCNFNYPTAGVLFDYPNKRISLFIETDARNSDVDKLIIQLKGSPNVLSVSPADCSFDTCG